MLDIYIILYSWNGEFPSPNSWVENNDGFFFEKVDAEKFLFDKGYFFHKKLGEYRPINPDKTKNEEWLWADIIKLSN